MMKRAAALFIFISFFTAGCSTMKEQKKIFDAATDAMIDEMSLKKFIPANDQLLDMEEFKVRPGFICFPVRADMVRREVKTEEKNSCLGIHYTVDEYEPVDYKFMGLELGNGLFVDSNSTLSLDLAEAIGFPEMENCTVTIEDETFGGGKVVIKKRGNKVKISEGGFWPDTTDVIIKEKAVTIDRGFFSADQNIVADDSSVAFKESGPMGFLNNEKLIKRGNSFWIPGLIMDNEFAVMEKNGSLYINGNVHMIGKSISYVNGVRIQREGYIQLRNEGKKISVNYDGRTFSLVRSKDRVLFYDNELFTGFMLEIHENEIVYTENGLLSSIVQKIKIEKN